jgi:membrane protease YdiL (CAAX protease family)
MFVNDEGRLRAGWRLLFQFLLNYVGAALVGSLLLVTGGAGRPPSVPNTWLYAGAALAAVASVWIAGRFLDGRPFSGFGLRLGRAWGSDLGFGLLLGAALISGIFIVELAAGWVTVTGAFRAVGGGDFFPAILAPVVLVVCVGFYEELVTRGYQLTNLAEGLNGPPLGPKGAVLLAWALSSSFFGLLHASNPNATLLGTLNIVLAGAMLGLGYVLTGELAIPIGLHITWNFFQGNVFGLPVSGRDPAGATFLSVHQAGPDLLTGGPFGPEGGLLGPAAMAVGMLLIALRIRRRSGKLSLHLPIAESPRRGSTPGS